MCGYRSFPVGGLAVADGNIGILMALARNGPGGMVDVVGHAPAMSPSRDVPAPNLIVHFADEVSGEKLDGLTNAFRDSNRTDAPTAIVVAAKASRISRLPYSESISYAEDDGHWRRQLGVNASGAVTVVVDPSGKPVWKAEGPVNERELSAALGKILVKGNTPKATMLSATARIGLPAPNFLFEHAPGQPLTLRKVSGRKVTVVFFNPASEPSVSAVRDAVAAAGDRAIVIAVSDGSASSPSELATAIVVPDARRQVASAYGVTMWPTIFSIDEGGIVRSISYGRSTRGEKSRA
jgi:peroxiredoxin